MANFKSRRQWNVIWDKIQGMLGFNGVESPFGAASYPAVDEPLVLYVETTGNDLNPGTQDRPFRTIQAAVDYLRQFKIEDHEVEIRVGSGTFDGFALSSFEMDRRGPASGSVSIVGTMSLVTLTSGANTGTATSTSGGTVTDTNQNWNPSELVGKFYLHTSASGAISYYPIVSATATSFVPMVVSTAVPSYSIVEPTTIIQNTSKLQKNSTSGTQCVVIGNAVPFVTVSQVKLTSTATNGNLVNVTASTASRVTFRACHFHLPTSGGSTTAVAMLSASSLIDFSTCFFDLQKASSIALSSTSGDLAIAFSYIKGGDKSQHGIRMGATYPSGRSYFAGTSTMYENLASCLSYAGTTAGYLPAVNGISGCYKDCAAIVNGRGDTHVGDIHSNLTVFPLASSGNTTGFQLDKDGRIQVASNVPSGLATNDINVAGATSTLAAMRALSPKVFPSTPNVYGSYVFE